MSDEPTCGRGLAEHSRLPAKLADLITAVGDNLELHLDTLDRTDPAAEQEHAAYTRLVAAHRACAEQLVAIGREMAGYRDLPMGRHDEAKFEAPAFGAAFHRLVKVEEELLAIVKERLTEHRAMLGVEHARPA